MARELYRKIIDLILKAAELARSAGITNLLQPGLVKEMIIADILGHELIHSKRREDACDPHNPAITYEYLSCKEGGTGQIDRMFTEPAEKRAQSLDRITRNRMIFLAIFYRDDQTKCKVIYEFDPQQAAQEAERQLDRSRNVISHVRFSERWARANGRVVWPLPDETKSRGYSTGS